MQTLKNRYFVLFVSLFKRPVDSQRKNEMLKSLIFQIPQKQYILFLYQLKGIIIVSLSYKRQWMTYEWSTIIPLQKPKHSIRLQWSYGNFARTTALILCFLLLYYQTFWFWRRKNAEIIACVKESWVIESATHFDWNLARNQAEFPTADSPRLTNDIKMTL